MRVRLMLLLLFAALAIGAAAKDVKSKDGTKLRKVAKKVRKKSVKVKNTNKTVEQTKSESLNFPVVLTHVKDINHGAIPIRLHFSNGHLQSAIDPFPKEGPYPAEHYHGPKFEEHQPDSEDYFNNHHQGFNEYGDYPHEDNSYAGPSHQEADGGFHQVVQLANHYQVDDHEDLSAIPGVPGVDYPTYAKLPETHFECLKHTGTPGFYADVDTKCQVWHYCQPDGRHDRFLCPNGTVFDQHTRVCNWWFNVDCDASLSMYDINFDLYREPEKPPSQHIDAPSQHIHRTGLASHSFKEDVLHPNTFLSHVKQFSENIAQHRKPVEFESEPTYEESVENHQPSFIGQHTEPAANPQHQHYSDHDTVPVAVKLIRDPLHVVAEPAAIHSHESPHEIRKEPEVYAQEHPDHHHYVPPIHHYVDHSPNREKLAKRKRYKVFLHELSDEIPVYRERKASPPAGRKQRIIKRRKNHHG